MEIPDSLSTYLEAMKQFAALADLFQFEAVASADWEAVARFTSSVEPYLREVCEESRRLIKNHEELLGLGVGTEPFRVDYGMHRWLQDESEPAYSDWLQWLVEAITRRDWICTLFGIAGDPRFINASIPNVSAVTRELRIWGQQKDKPWVGYLDLDVWFGDDARIVIELKKFDQSFEKQSRYKEAVDAGRVETRFVLLTKDYPDNETVFGFRARNWESFCLEARRIVPAVTQERGVVIASLLLAFIGAVEQNILKFSRDGIRKLFSEVDGASVPKIDSRTFRYLQKLP